MRRQEAVIGLMISVACILAASFFYLRNEPSWMLSFALFAFANLVFSLVDWKAK